METSQNPQAIYPWQGLDASERVGVMWDQAPPDCTWGCRVSDDFVLASASVTLWFSSAHELVSWFAMGDPDLDDRFTDEKRVLIREELMRLASTVRADDYAAAKLQTALQDVLSGWIRVEWLGTYDELCSASTDDARETRKHFNLLLSRAASDDAISANEEAAFATFLAEFWRGV